jgi:hypothetical protein
MAKKFPDLTGDGEVTKKDILKARGVEGFKKGGSAKFIQEAIKKPGALRKSLGVKKGEKIPAGKLAAAAKKPGKMGQRARLAQTLKGMK